MYRRNANLTFTFSVLALSAIALFAPLVGAQRQDEPPDLSRLLKPDELRQRHQQLKKKRDEMRTRLDDLRAGLIQQKKAMRAELAASVQSASSAPSTLESARPPAANKPEAGNGGGTVVVHSLADDGSGSLRQALRETSDGAKINITVKGTIRLTSGELIVDKSLTIRGPGKSHGSVSGNGVSRVFHITPGVTVSLEGLTIKDGRVTTEPGFFPASAGGGIYNDHATLTLNGCALSNNSARYGGGIFSNSMDGGTAVLTVNNTIIGSNSAQYGGGIFNGGGVFTGAPSGTATLTINNSALTGNSAKFEPPNFFQGWGGAIFNDGFLGEATATLNYTALSDNSAGAGGGGIYNNGDSGVARLTLAGSTIHGNSALSGAGIENDALESEAPSDAYVNLIDSTVTENSVSGGLGGSIYSFGNGADTIGNGARVSITRSEISRNLSGGVTNDGGALSVADSGILENQSYFGAGISNWFGTATLTNTVVSDNVAEQYGGGIYNEDGTLTLNNSTVRNNSTINSPSGARIGAGIHNLCVASFSSTVTLRNSTVSHNIVSSNTGAAIFSAPVQGSATVTLVNSTVSSNSGIGIETVAIGTSQIAVLRLMNSTVSNNSAGGVLSLNLLDGTATAEISNTIFNANVDGSIASNGTVTSLGYNLSDDAAGGDGSTGPGGLLNGPGDMRNTNPHLGPLQDNGGPTMTHALLPFSPAIDNGNPNFNPNAFDPPLLYDQRGQPFSRVVNGCIDIGAFEFRSP